MKIAQVVSTFPPYKGGIGNTAYNFALALQNQGVGVTTFFPQYFPLPIAKSNLKVKLCQPLLSKGNAAFVPGICNDLKDYDVIFFHYPFVGGVEAVLWRKIIQPKIKLVVYYHQDLMPPKDLLRKFIFTFYNWIWLPLLVRLASAVIVSSIDYAEHSNLRHYYASHKTKFFSLAFGVDQQIFTPLAEDTKRSLELKKILNWQPEVRIVTYVGNISSTHYFKGIDLLLYAVNGLLKEGVKLKLCLVGNGDRVEYYKNKAKELGVSDQTYFFSNLDDTDLNTILNLSDVLVLPSINRAEAFGLVLVEAMAAGTPVISSDLPGVRTVYDNGISGLTFKINDHVDLAAKIKKIITNPDLQAAFSQAALLKAKQYNWPDAGQKLIEIFNKLGVK